MVEGNGEDLFAAVNLQSIRFEEGICHRCNLVPPSTTWCHPMYGGVFKQGYGWYIAQARLRLGVGKYVTGPDNVLRYILLVTPPEIRELVDDAAVKQTAHLAQRGLVSGLRAAQQPFAEEETELVRVRRIASKAANRLSKVIEDIARTEFGFKNVGEGWVAESQVAQIVAAILPGEEIIRCGRPDWLEGLEIDIWVPGRRLAIEYQGQQHYHAVTHWGGEAGLAGVQARDRRKRELLTNLGIELIDVKYTEPLTIDHIRNRLARHLGAP